MKVVNNPIFLSIVIPVYNAEKYLETTLDSLVPLTGNSEVEVILVNDGSTDSSKRLIDKWSKGVSAVTVIDTPNRGVSAARNQGCERAKGEYVWFVDADDAICATEVADLAHAVKRSQDDAVWFNYVNIRERGGQDPCQRYKEEKGIEEKSYTVDQYLRSYFKGEGMLWAYWLKRSVITRNSLRFDESAKWFEDFDFLLRFLCHAHTIYISNAIVYQYRYNMSGAMRNSTLEDRHRCSVMLSVSQKKYLDEHPVNPKRRKLLMKFVAISVAWCIREAADSYALELYKMCKDGKMFPLTPSGSWKQKLQIAVLDLGFNIYRHLCKII